MKISLGFLQICLKHVRAEIRMGQRPHRYDNVALYTPDRPIQPGTLYFCAPGVQVPLSGRELEENECGTVWTENRTPPPDLVETFWIQEERDPLMLFSEISMVFSYFQNWSQRVREAIIEKKTLEELGGLLEEVTPNPWYIADASFRVQAISRSAEVAELSVIWKFMCRQRHVPVGVILQLEESGKLEKMNRARHACIEDASPFNFPYVSKTICTGQGIIGHFFIIGVYTNITAYELEIAEFFGNLINRLAEADSAYMPTLGRYYDNYFIDLIENPGTADVETIAEVFHRLSWETDDRYILIIFRHPNKRGTESIIDRLGIQTLERQHTCKAFLYQDDIVAILNVSRENRESAGGNIQDMIAASLKVFGGIAGYSDILSGEKDFDALHGFYQQALAALQAVGAEDSGGRRVEGYGKIAVRYLCERMSEFLPTQMFCHPCMEILRRYDMEHHTELERTLYQYLIHNQNTVETARQLFIHRNSLLYRLDKIKTLTDVDLENPDDCVRIIFAYTVTR